LSQARGQLGELTQNLRLLVVLDDVWEPEAADPFQGLGSKCRVLITTRDARVLTRANADCHDLSVLPIDAARDFLATATELHTADELPAEANEIIQHCGHLPLALAAISALIRTKTYTWLETLEALEEGATDELDTSWLPDPEQSTLAVVLRMSVETLTPTVRDWSAHAGG
jgi:hypothetical protein